MAEGPEAESLAKLLEADVTVRRRFRELGHMTRWPSIHTVGVASCKAMACNARILEILAEWWCPTQEAPAIVPIEIMRREVNALRGPRHMDLKKDPLQAELDADQTLDDFFHILEWYWTQLREEDPEGPTELLMLEDGSVDDPYTDSAVDAVDSSTSAAVNDNSSDAALSDATTLQLAPLTPPASTDDSLACNPETVPEPVPPPEALPSDPCDPEPVSAPEALPSDPCDPEPVSAPAAISSDPNGCNPVKVPEPLSAPEALPNNPGHCNPNEVLTAPPSSKNPGEVAQMSPSTLKEDPSQSEPCTPQQHKLAKLPQFQISDQEDQRALLKAQMDQRIAAL
ncbi:HERC1, partial [Symbiodinium sp. CCMP2592]